MGCTNSKPAEEPTFHSLRADRDRGTSIVPTDTKREGSGILSLKPDAESLSESSAQRKRSTDPMREISASSPTPRLHKMPSRATVGNELTDEVRNLKLRDASDEQLLAEVDRRNIQMHGRVSSELVELKYRFGKLLGQGSSAAVYAAELKGGYHMGSVRSARSSRASGPLSSADKFAIKVIERNDFNDDESMQMELDVLRHVRHKYILSCHEIFESADKIWVVMELIEGGDVYDVLRSRSTYTEEDASRLVRQVLMAVRYLHSQGIVHRDIKLPNILLTSSAANADAKLADFGLAARLEDDYDPSNARAAKGYRELCDPYGTPEYFAPELLAEAYGPQVDVWSVGVVLFELLCGSMPFGTRSRSDEDLFEEIEHVEVVLKVHFKSKAWAQVSEAAKDLVTKLLHPNPEKRLSAAEALEHPWIALKGTAEARHLGAAHEELKKHKAQQRLCQIWHVLDIVNALDEATKSKGKAGKAFDDFLTRFTANDRTSARKPTSIKPPSSRRVFRGKKPSPELVKEASEVSHYARATRPEADEESSRATSTEPSASRPRSVSQTDLIDELQATFALFDHDHNGFISHEEISVLMRCLGFRPAIETLRELVDQHDKDRDGQLDFSEFCSLLTNAKNGGLFADAIGQELRTLSSTSSSSASTTGVEESGEPKPSSSKSSDLMSAADIRKMMTEIRRHTGQLISDEEIEDVIAMVEANEGKGRGRSVTIEQVQEIISMPSKLRHEKAAPRRSTNPPQPPKSILELRGDSQYSQSSTASIDVHPTI